MDEVELLIRLLKIKQFLCNNVITLLIYFHVLNFFNKHLLDVIQSIQSLCRSCDITY